MSFQARIIFRQNRCIPCNEWLWETCAPPSPFPACHLNLASQSRESHLNKFAQAGRRQYWWLLKTECNTRCIECVTHNNSVFAKEREGLAVLPELKLALAEYGNKGWKRLKPENQLGLNAKQQQGYSCTFYSNGVAVETFSALPQPTPSIAPTTPSPLPTTTATAAPTKIVGITRETR